MKNFFNFLFLIISLSFSGIGVNEAYAQPDCLNFSLAPGLPSTGPNIGKIVPDGSGYAYQVNINNSGSMMTGMTVVLNITTTEFTINNTRTGLTLNNGNNSVNFAITSSISSITNPYFGVPTSATISQPSTSFITCNTPSLQVYPINTANWGCTDPMSLNYDPTATFDNGTCVDDICGELEIIGLSIVNDAFGNPVLQVIIRNNSITYSIGNSSSIEPVLTNSNPSFSLQPLPNQYPFEAASGGDFDVIQIGLVTPLTNLTGPISLITGSITVNATGIDTCSIDFANIPLDISNLGCTDINAFNYNTYATVDNGTCVEDLVVGQTIIQPICEGDPGKVTLNISGGTPGYTVNTHGKDLNNLPSGFYTFEITDNTDPSIGGPIVKNIDVEIDYPDAFVVDLDFSPPTTLLFDANGSFTTWYYILLDGVLIDSTQSNSYVYSTPGEYSVYAETHINSLGQQCWDYSNPIVLTQLSVNDFELNNIDIFPNPNTGNFTIEMGEFENTNTEIIIYNTQGQAIYNKLTSSFNGVVNVSIEDMYTGLYYLKIINGSSTYRTKFIKE